MPLACVAAFQVTLWRGAPYGDAVLGGRAATVGGVLTGPYRWAALGQAGLLLAMAVLLLGRGGVMRLPVLTDSGLRRAAWAIAAFMTINTVANFSAPHPLERRMGVATLTVALLSATLGASSTRGDGPTAGPAGED